MSTPGTIPAPSFIHDLDTCVGCHACVIACANENRLSPGRFWRQIVSFNPAHVPDLPVFHLSLACNHCLDAPCVTACPALAIARDGQTGAVVIDNAKCIGCRYCSWVCPFDAPQFNSDAGVMEKCTFCNHRLLQGLQPACTSLCPTGALSTGNYGEKSGVPVDGFPDTKIRPAISFLPMRGRSPQPAPPGAALPDESQTALWASRGSAEVPESKIALKTEGPLAVFSFVAIALVAWFLASLRGEPAVVSDLFGALGVVGIGLSTMHLGRKERAWRAILNWRGSWLSREVLAYSTFIGIGWISGKFFPGIDLIAWVAAFAGVMLLIAVDNVYVAMARERSSHLDGQVSLLSAAFLVSVLTGSGMLALVTGLLRLYGLIDRMRTQWKKSLGKPKANWLRVFRAIVGLVLPALLWMMDGEASASVLVCVLLGEFADRLDFYDSLDIITPRRSMARALMKSAAPGVHPVGK